MSLYRGPEGPLYKAVKEKPGMLWGPQEVRDARAMGYVLRGPANRTWSQPKRKKRVCCSQQSWKELEICRPFNIRYGDAVFGVFPVFFQSSISSLCSHPYILE